MVDVDTILIAASSPHGGSGARWRIAVEEVWEEVSEDCSGLSGSVGACWVSEACEETVAFVTTGLGAATLAGLLDFRLSVGAFLAAQLAEDGSAEPSPLSLRLIASSWVPLLGTGCDAADMLCGAC